MPYNLTMHTVIETPTFQRRATETWTAREYEAFIVYIAENPLTGKLIPGTGGVRKVRWSASGRGKRGGVRIIYFSSHEREVWLLTMYAKNQRETIPAHELRLVREAINGENVN
jgi:hypothetical protein